MAKLVYTDKSSFLTNNFKTVNVGSRVFDLQEKKWYRVSAPGTLVIETPEVEDTSTES